MELNDALAILDVDKSLSPEKQLDAARRHFLVMAMKEHPDKGGDAERFIEVKKAYELVLTNLKATDDLDGAITALATFVSAKETVPPYAVQVAVRKRKCQRCAQPIEAGAPCFGFFWSATGMYGGWRHVDKQCLKVPSRLHTRFTALDILHGNCANDETEAFRDALRSSEDVVNGIDKLTPKHFGTLLDLVTDRDTWCKITPAFESKMAAEAAEAEARAADVPVVEVKKAAIVPLAPIDTAQIKGGVLNGKVVVLSGLFDLPGAQSGLAKGKDQVETIIAKAGGRVTGSLSGKTTHLLIGRLPGGSKISKAETLGVKVIALPEFLKLLHGANDKDIEAVSTNVPRSKGFGGVRLEGPPAKVPRLEA